MPDYDLSAIIDWQMTETEALAYKIGLLWLHWSKEIFPKYLHSHRFPKKGNPMKCSLFKFCHKMLRETQGLIKNNEYQLFVIAQLKMLASIDVGGYHPQITPQCLTGDKAWIRWKIWKRKYNAINSRQTKEDIGLDVIPIEAICKEMQGTKTFLTGRLGSVNEEQIMMASRDIERWVSLGKVSVFYALLCPFVKKHCKNLTVDPKLYEPSITPEVQACFDEMFKSN